MVWQVPANWSKLNYVCNDTDFFSFYSNYKKKVKNARVAWYFIAANNVLSSYTKWPDSVCFSETVSVGETAATTSQLGLNTCSVCTWESAGIKKEKKSFSI